MRPNRLLLILIATATSCNHSTPQTRVSSSHSTLPATAPARITEFQGPYRFLSNFYPAQVEFEGLSYPTVEHAYQSAKTLNMDDRKRIAAAPTPAAAKAAGRAMQPLRPDWDTAKFQVMETCLRYKFTQHPDLRAALLATGDAHLEEGNTWNDTIWGTVNGVGDNRLGKLLMKIRSELRGAPATNP